ncbi:hypothetical protein O181_114122 [Austropuccinia psidii MF-1]|uniref:Uncharacterized protein n=1 Tax=Austropuccinia psidii MF-1 TaxID=1389203 RepID=A0A9Q3K514_9BASI|nr:hypothetical protein [Austropuccinia psidii MF-1]
MPKKTPKTNQKVKAQVEQALPAELQDSQEREHSHGQCVQYGKNSNGIQKQGIGSIEPIVSKEVDLVKIVNQIETCNKEIITKAKTFDYIQQTLGNEILQVKESQKTIIGLEIQLKELRIQAQNLENSTGNNAALFQEQLGKSDKARIELKEDIQLSVDNISLKNDLSRQSTPILDRNVLNLNNDLHHTISSNAEVETTCNFKEIPRLEEWLTFSG